MTIDTETLYYTFSTIPQVLAALIAILAAFVHFKIGRLQEDIIGNAKTLFENWDLYSPWFDTEDKKEKAKERLKDAINRKSIRDIEFVTFKIMMAEGSTLTGEMGKKLVKYIKPNADIPTSDFSKRRSIHKKSHTELSNKIEVLKKRTITVTKLAIFTIFISILWLTFFDIIFITVYTKIFALLGTFVLTGFTLFFSYKIIILGFTEKGEGKSGEKNKLTFNDLIEEEEEE
ncbi:MAG: hypothetical protein KGY69_14590 [Bacteroidales bacterium]|nr:hypothetical protein [Bacteroidales bacterium]